MKSNKKKIIVLSFMVVLLVVSAVLNVWLNNKLNKQADVAGKVEEPAVTTTFSSFRSSRETSRQELFDYLDAIITAEATSAEAKTAAETQKQDICNQMETELLLESLIKAKGFEDVIVTLSDKNCTVVVADSDLQAAEVAQILNVVTSETNYTAKNIVVSNY